jgi:hypothetical protein
LQEEVTKFGCAGRIAFCIFGYTRYVWLLSRLAYVDVLLGVLFTKEEQLCKYVRRVYQRGLEKADSTVDRHGLAFQRPIDKDSGGLV